MSDPKLCAGVAEPFWLRRFAPPPRAPDTRAFRLSGSPGCRASVLVWSLGGANARVHS